MAEERRRPDALEAGVRALHAREHSATSLDARLERRGIDADQRAAAVVRLQELGYLDDERFARSRAAALAARGAGDLLITDDLERHGIAAELVEKALAALEPEVDRARAILARRGASARTARLLASKGFGEDVVEGVVAALAEEPLG
jgi:regulatory protein